MKPGTAPDAIASDYRHKFHAGNHADVWKHVALGAALADRPGPVVETHAGDGLYRLLPTGEWTEGVGRALGAWSGPSGAAAVDRYLAAVRAAGAGVYPGSPWLARRWAPDHRYVGHELRDEAAAALQREVPGCDVRVGDGWAGLRAAEVRGAWVVVDPPYVAKDEWVKATDAVAWAHAAGASVLLWYPTKSWSRPNLLHQRLRAAKVPFVAIDLVVTPVELERRALAGSGVVLVGARPAVLAEVHAAAAILGPVLATHGQWFVRTNAAL